MVYLTGDGTQDSVEYTHVPEAGLIYNRGVVLQHFKCPSWESALWGGPFIFERPFSDAHNAEPSTVTG